ncbi:MAG: single-stranded-DNA-specific exonuclease RecJ [bacterium]
MDAKWVLSDNSDSSQVEALANELRIPKALARILINRRIESFEEAKSFFRPNIARLHDPFLMKDMDVAVDRLIGAIERRDKVVIYGDYDVDGTTSISMLTLFFKRLGLPTRFYIPDRLKEGYGLSTQGIREIREWGADLILTTDCGITASEEAALANQLGMDVIISDHHEPADELPNALAILDPKRPECEYPFKELAGIGVAFKLIQGITTKLGLDEEHYQAYLDLACIGSAADIVPLVDENRILVHAGLQKINDSPSMWIRSLIRTAGLRPNGIGTGQIVFSIAPRINAVGRMGKASRAVHLLTTNSEKQANNIASILESENQIRRRIDEDTFQQASTIVDNEIDLTVNRFIVLSREGWHPGVIGIVASRVVEKYYRPTVLITHENGAGRGSVRSVPGFDVYKALKSCSNLMLGFGGHKYAAGLTIESKNIPAFNEQLNLYARENMAPDTLIPKIRVDSELELNEITPLFIKVLKLFAPFGPQNMRPVFMSRNLEIVGKPRVVGKNHLKFKVRQNGTVVDAMGFDLGDLLYRLLPGENNLDLVYGVEENEYMGLRSVQLRVKALR